MPPASDPRPILLADDNADDLFFARRALEKAGQGAPILACVDGREVVALLKAMVKNNDAVPRAVFLDVKMPKMDGFKTLKWIRTQKYLEKVGVVMLSGSAESRDIAMARKFGANDYLVKYPSLADFSRVIAALDGRS